MYIVNKKRWEGPFCVTIVQSPKSVVLDVSGKLKEEPFNVAQIKPAKTTVQDGFPDLEQLEKQKNKLRTSEDFNVSALLHLALFRHFLLMMKIT